MKYFFFLVSCNFIHELSKEPIFCFDKKIDLILGLIFAHITIYSYIYHKIQLRFNKLLYREPFSMQSSTAEFAKSVFLNFYILSFIAKRNRLQLSAMKECQYLLLAN